MILFALADKFVETGIPAPAASSIQMVAASDDYRSGTEKSAHRA